MSGLAINYNKSTFISWKRDDYPWVNEIANDVGCMHARPPFTYLGFPLGSNFSRYDAWKPVIRNIENRLASWKVRLLSRAGRLTLIKSVLNSLPVYFMSLFQMPKTVAAKIVKLQRRFFWGGTAGESKCCPPIKLSYPFCVQICLERMDGSSKVVGPLSSPPYAVHKVQHPMDRAGQGAKT